MTPDFRSLRVWIILVLGWSVPALAMTTRAYYGTRDNRIVPTLAQIIELEAAPWVLWALMTPLVFGLARRLPVDRVGWMAALGVHGALCLTILVASSGATVATLRRLMGAPEISRFGPFEGMAQIASQRALPVLAIYAALAATAYAVILNVRLQTRRLQHARLQADLSRAELQALKMQLRPHFLFNALQSVSTLVSTDPKAARSTLTRLGDLLRTTLRHGELELVSLADELTLVGHYLEIERTRFRDRLEVDVRVDDAAHNSAVPVFVLQPLVENALRHGLGKRLKPGRITIEVTARDGNLGIRVRDDGPGWPDDLREGMGLTITRRRLANLYGDSARLTLRNVAGGGAVAEVTIPLRKVGSAPAAEVPV